MIRYLLVFVCFVGLTTTSYAQDVVDKDTWYVWLDTYAEVDGEKKRLVSEKVTVINCCVKSPKYRKLLKTTVKWIRKNVDENYKGEESPLGKIQDKSLAEISLKKAQEAEGVHLVSYSEVCK